MRKSILKLVTLYLAWLLLFLLQKPCFMLVYRDLFRGERVDSLFQVMLHGLPLDLSVAAYFTFIPGLLLIAQLWLTRMSRWPWRIYFALVAGIYTITFLLNLVLYRYWGFPLDTTPFYYFLSSPADAFASVSGWLMALGIGAALVLAVLVWWLMMSLVGGARLPWYPLQRRLGYSVVLLLCVGLLILPMRGGITVSVMNTGEAYFSANMRLNHAAINPVFSLLESYSKQVDFAAQYRFMPEKQARNIFRSMVCTRRANSDTLLSTRHPNIYIVILESFSRKVMETDATPHLNALRKEGLFFDNFYANSFRTDRGILSILSGYPAQPTTSLMRYPAKTDKLPSIGKTLQKQGYALHYYYGGDANFTNMRSYLTGMGFTHIVSDSDFPLSARLSKWGVPDHLVFQRALDDAKKAAWEHALPPQLNVIQTSSSHEPFDVPYHRLPNKILNAFAYTDAWVGHFVAALKKLPQWRNTLVIILPDHLGCYPENISSTTPQRYHIPMLWLGGAVKQAQVVSQFGSQHDLAATLLGQLGLSHEPFLFSKDLFDAHASHFAFFTSPDIWGMVTAEQQMVYDNAAQRVVYRAGNGAAQPFEAAGKAYLQELYNDIAKR